MLIFFHIPKTAGTTFHGILENEYKNNTFTVDGIHWKNSLNILAEWKENDFDDINLIKGHLTYSLRHNPILKNRELIFISYFRNPVDLFLSTYTYIKKQPLNKYHSQANNMTLEEWMEFRKDEYLDNLQSRHLLERLPHFNPLNKDLNLSLINEKELKTELLNRLETIKYTFSTDNFDTSLLFLQQELNWKKTPYYISKNISSSKKKKVGIDTELLKKIEDINWLDMYLFKVIQEKEMKSIDSITHKSMRSFQTINKYWKYLKFIRALFP